MGQLRRNLSRILPDADRRELSRATRAAMRSYMRYFYEAFALPGLTPDQRAARVRPVMGPEVRRDVSRGFIVIALPHMGNWDMAGAWACIELARVLTVAERLEPPDLFEQFVAFRFSTVRPANSGSGSGKTRIDFKSGSEPGICRGG